MCRDRFTLLQLGEGNFSFALAFARHAWKKRNFQSGGTSGAAASDRSLRCFADDLRGRALVRGYLDLSDGGDIRNRRSHPHHSLELPATSMYEASANKAAAVFFESGEMIATSFDSHEDLLFKYPEYRQIEMKLSTYHQHVIVKHGVNAWNLDASFGPRQFDCIAWNHPHIGVENFRLHRFLLAHFFHEAAAHLKAFGRVILAVVSQQAERWEMVPRAQAQGFTLVNVAPFHADEWPGYETRRNKGGKSFQNTHTKTFYNSAMPSWKYVFVKIANPPLSQSPKNRHTTGCLNEVNVEESEVDNTSRQARNEEPSCGPLPRTYGCSFCSRAFATAQGKYTHEKQVHELKKYADKSAAAYRCSTCLRVFDDAEALQQHCIAVHRSSPDIDQPVDEELYEIKQNAVNVAFKPCSICGQAIPTDSSLEWHLEQLKPLVGLKMPCKFCFKLYGEPRALHQHTKVCEFRQRNERSKQSSSLGGIGTIESESGGPF